LATEQQVDDRMSHFSPRFERRQVSGGAWNGACYPAHRAGCDDASAAYSRIFSPSMMRPNTARLAAPPGRSSSAYRACRPGDAARPRAWRALN